MESSLVSSESEVISLSCEAPSLPLCTYLCFLFTPEAFVKCLMVFVFLYLRVRLDWSVSRLHFLWEGSLGHKGGVGGTLSHRVGSPFFGVVEPSIWGWIPSCPTCCLGICCPCTVGQYFSFQPQLRLLPPLHGPTPLPL